MCFAVAIMELHGAPLARFVFFDEGFSCVCMCVFACVGAFGRGMGAVSASNGGLNVNCRDFAAFAATPCHLTPHKAITHQGRTI